MKSSGAGSHVCSVRDAVSETEGVDSDGVLDLCTCGGEKEKDTAEKEESA